MKFKVIFSLLFVIATTLTALHELKHIENHDTSTCQVCIVDNHSISADVITPYDIMELFSFEAIESKCLIALFFAQTKNNQTRAPPFLS